MQVLSFEAEGAAISAGVDVADVARSVVVIVQAGSPRPHRRSRAALAAARAVGAGVVTVQILTAEEASIDASTGAVRFDIGRLGRRLAAALDKLRDCGVVRAPVAVHATGTGAAAALVAAATRPAAVRSVVSSAGRPDLAVPVLPRVRAPVLLLVGGRDLHGVRASCEALRYLPSHSELALIPGAAAPLDDPREQEGIAERLCRWWSSTLVAAPASAFGAGAP